MPEPDWSELREAFRRDGLVFLPGALDRKALDLARAAFDWTLAHPGPGASRFYGQGPATFYQDLANPEAPSAYATLLRDSPLADIAARLWGSDDVWFFYEQVFLKEGGDTRRTPWHQDLPYLPIQGEQLAVFWIVFDPVAKEDALEFVPGSHRGTLYNGSAFDPADDTAPIYPGDPLPRLPDIEADRAAWPIVSWAVKPGDVLAFHPAILHGGAATRPGARRRTLSLRLFGADAAYVPRPRADGMPEFTFTRIGEVLKPAIRSAIRASPSSAPEARTSAPRPLRPRRVRRAERNLGYFVASCRPEFTMNLEYRPEGLLRLVPESPCARPVGLEMASCAPEHPKSRELLAYWEARKSPDGFVHRSAIEPWEIVRLLPNLLIAEPASAGGWSYRLFGTGLAERLGRDLTGKSLPFVFDPETAGMVDHLYWTVATDNRMVAVRGRFLGLGIEHAMGEGLHLPILARDNSTVQVLGGVFFLD